MAMRRTRRRWKRRSAGPCLSAIAPGCCQDEKRPGACKARTPAATDIFQDVGRTRCSSDARRMPAAITAKAVPDCVAEEKA